MTTLCEWLHSEQSLLGFTPLDVDEYIKALEEMRPGSIGVGSPYWQRLKEVQATMAARPRCRVVRDLLKPYSDEEVSEAIKEMLEISG